MLKVCFGSAEKRNMILTGINSLKIFMKIDFLPKKKKNVLNQSNSNLKRIINYVKLCLKAKCTSRCTFVHKTSYAVCIQCTYVCLN